VFLYKKILFIVADVLFLLLNNITNN